MRSCSLVKLKVVHFRNKFCCYSDEKICILLRRWQPWPEEIFLLVVCLSACPILGNALNLFPFPTSIFFYSPPCCIPGPLELSYLKSSCLYCNGKVQLGLYIVGQWHKFHNFDSVLHHSGFEVKEARCAVHTTYCVKHSGVSVMCGCQRNWLFCVYSWCAADKSSRMNC